MLELLFQGMGIGIIGAGIALGFILTCAFLWLLIELLDRAHDLVTQKRRRSR